jgi:hypothetical protein
MVLRDVHRLLADKKNWKNSPLRDIKVCFVQYANAGVHTPACKLGAHALVFAVGAASK